MSLKNNQVLNQRPRKEVDKCGFMIAVDLMGDWPVEGVSKTVSETTVEVNKNSKFLYLVS